MAQLGRVYQQKEKKAGGFSLINKVQDILCDQIIFPFPAVVVYSVKQVLHFPFSTTPSFHPCLLSYFSLYTVILFFTDGSQKKKIFDV
jgi:hypothetical protein